MKRWVKSLWLVTPEEFENLPRNLILTAIDGTKHIVSDLARGPAGPADFRFGVTAYGLTEEGATAPGFSEEFLLMVLNS
jgi:hypothetical protein